MWPHIATMAKFSAFGYLDNRRTDRRPQAPCPLPADSACERLADHSIRRSVRPERFPSHRSARVGTQGEGPSGIARRFGVRVAVEHFVSRIRTITVALNDTRLQRKFAVRSISCRHIAECFGYCAFEARGLIEAESFLVSSNTARSFPRAAP